MFRFVSIIVVIEYQIWKRVQNMKVREQILLLWRRVCGLNESICCYVDMCKLVSLLVEWYIEIVIYNLCEEFELKLLIIKCGIDLNRFVIDQRSVYK